jgi:hypothetical protein
MCVCVYNIMGTAAPFIIIIIFFLIRRRVEGKKTHLSSCIVLIKHSTAAEVLTYI